MELPQRPQRYCRYCAAQVSPGDAFCESCGGRLALEPGPAAREARGAPAAAPRGVAGPALARLLPPDPLRAVLAGASLAAGVAALLVGLVYALLALGGAFADPSVPRTLGLAVFSLMHGGAVSASVPPTPSLLGIGGSLRLSLPATSFALLPFLAALLMGRVLARRAGSTVLFAAAAGLAYAIVVGVLSAIGVSAQDAGDGAAVRFAADPLSGAWRAFLWAGLGALLGATAARGPLLPPRARQVLRGALAAVGVSVALTVLLVVVLLAIQVLFGSPAQQGSPEAAPAAPVPGIAAAGGGLPAAIGVLFALLPAALGALWLLAHGLPFGLQGVPDFGGMPLVGSALSELPLSVSLLGDWPLEAAWRLLLLGPAVGFVAGGMLAARWAPVGARWWQGALIAVPYAFTAAPSLDDWETAGGVPGIYAVASKGLARGYTDEQLVASGPFDLSACEPGARSDFERGPYTGRTQAWRNCEVGATATFVTLSAAPEGRECVVLMQLAMYGEADVEVEQHILDAFEVECAAAATYPLAAAADEQQYAP